MNKQRHNSRLSRIILTTLLLTIVATSTSADTRSPICEADLFADDKLVRVDITIPQEDWDVLRSQTRSFASALRKDTVGERPFTYFRGDVSINGVKMNSVGIRKKGFLGSLDDTRPSLKIKFNEYTDNGRIGRIDRLTLNNNKQDPTNCFAFLGYRLYRKAGLPAPRCGLAVVTVNGESLGIYSNVESVRKPFLKNEFGDNDGNLYEGTYPADFLPDRVARLEAKTNEKDNDRSHIEKLAKLLEHEDEQLEARLSELVDLDQFHTFWALESLISFWDGYCANQNNYFVYLHPKDAKLRFIPWGLDSAFANSKLTPFNPGPASLKARGIVAFRLYQIPERREKHVATLRHLLETVWDEKQLLADIDRVSEMTKDFRHKGQGDLKRSTNEMKAFISFRRRLIENEIKNGPVEYTTPPPPPTYAKQTAELSGSFATFWADKFEGKKVETGQAELKLRVDGEVVPFKRTGAIAEPQRPTPFAPRPAVPPPTVAFSAERESDGKTLDFWLGFANPLFHPSDGQPLHVQGLMMERGNFFTMRFFVGTSVLKEAEQKEGAAISGTFDGALFQIKTPAGAQGRRRRPESKPGNE